ncbi:MAG: Smr/MutS family protein [Bacteroidia bacterium]|nr:Smr/MutS family protein [Bacteroidia bacterium]
MIYPADCEQKLGFDQVRTRLKDYCISSLGEKRVDGIQFNADFSIIKNLLQQNLEFKQILEKGDSIPTSNYFDPEELVPTIAIEESFIEEDAFVQIINSLHSIFEFKQFLLKSKEIYPALFFVSEPVILPKHVLSTLQSRFDDHGKVKDNASHELGRIRKRFKEEQVRARKLVEQIFRIAADQGFVPEGMSPTIRDGRTVIPILAEHKRKIKGFVADESSTGQTIFLEPAEVLEANNEIRDLQLAERREIVKILKELTKILRANLVDFINAYAFLGQMDFNRAKAKFSIDIEADLPQIKDKPDLNWMHARHPLLQLSLKGKRSVVPLTIDLTEDERMLLISGPNAGGKSVCLKTVGLIQYMLQCGMLVPLHEKSTVGLFDDIFLDIGDQQSIENDLSTYSSHLKNMGFFLQHSSASTLVLMDELGAGTDPNFGGGIAQAILEALLKKDVWGVATTHYYNLKLFAGKNEGIRNGAMQFDTKKLEPLFLLEIGKPGSSFALEIARKTGLPSATIQEAEKIIGKELTGLEMLMKAVADEKQSLVRRDSEMRQKEKELGSSLEKYTQLSNALEKSKKEILNKAKSEASYLLQETNREIEKTIRHIQENKAEKKETRKVRQNLIGLIDKVKPEGKTTPIETLEIKEGDKVRIIGQEVTGTVLSVKANSAVVQFGDLRSTLKTKQLIHSQHVVVAKESTTSRARQMGVDIHKKQSLFNSTLDVRGKRVDEVIPVLIQFLDDALLLSQHELRILHGKGEGVLRSVIRDQLKQTKGIASYADEHVERGGAGITVVVLK